ncbi:MAG: hypothetical protein ABR987_02215 [Terracidiphilus sp.]
MKAKTLLLFVSFACVPAVSSFGQVDCSSSTKLVCQFPFSAQTLSVFAAGTSSTTALAKAAEAVANPINASIATQLTQLPIPSATVGVVTLQKKGSEFGTTFDNLGPVLTDRPDTVGKGHIFAGFSYQHFNFNSLAGNPLSKIPIGFQYPIGNVTTSYDAVNNQVSFKLDQYVGIATYGATRRTDISVVVPINSVTLAVTTSGFQGYQYNTANQTYGQIFSPTTSVSSNGTASGIGDITVILKQMVLGQEGSRGAVAAGITARFPSGDALNYLGSGAFGGSIYGLFEYRARIAPHMKLSYQWNGNSQVMNLQALPTVGLPGGLQYAAGADFKIVRKLTLAADILGNQFVNVPSFTSTNPNLPGPAGQGGIPKTIPFTTSTSLTYTTANFSGGLKWSPIAHFLLYGNVLVQLNNVGLRSDPVPLFGIAYNFKATH